MDINSLVCYSCTVIHLYSCYYDTQINLGLLDKNENKGDKMLQILQCCSAEYVQPVDTDANITHKINFGGDHLTIERAISAVSAVADHSDIPQERLKWKVLY